MIITCTGIYYFTFVIIYCMIFLMSDYFKVADVHSSNIRLCFSATWFQLESALCPPVSLSLSVAPFPSLFPPSPPPLSLSLSLSLPPLSSLFNSVPGCVFGLPLFSLCLFHTCIVQAYTMIFLCLFSQ